MQCFYHDDTPSIATCFACGRGLCRQCAVDLERMIACQRCEVEARRLIDLRDFSLAQPHAQRRLLDRASGAQMRSAAFMLLVGSAFLFLYFLRGGGDFEAIIGGLLITYGIVLSVAARRRTVATEQFRLCGRCGYNVTGNTTGKCPECGSFI